jgi:hypothetical protein
MEKQVRLSSGESLKEFLETVVSETVKSALYQRSLLEKEKQDAASGISAAEPGEAPDLDMGDDEVDSGSATHDDDKEALEKGDVEASDVIDKLNSIRSGHSFRDHTVKQNMEQYVDSLSKAEKTALLAFLKGISQIVTGEVPAPKAVDPGANPSDVKMEKGPEGAKTKHVKPNVIKGKQPQKKEKGVEDTTAPAPIIPKKK